MTASSADVQQKLDSAVTELKQTGATGAHMVATYGTDPSKWPPGHWLNAMNELAAARSEVGLLVDPAAPAPTPTPVPSGDTYDTLVAALVPPQMSVVRHKVCTTRAEHDAAVSAIQPGDWIECQGINFVGTVAYGMALSGYAKITFQGCTWNPGSGKHGIWIKPGARYLQLHGQEMALTSLARVGIIQYGPSDHIVVDGWTIHGAGSGGIGATCVNGDIHHCWYRNEVYNIATNLSYDGHTDKGSGLHCMLTGDGPGGAFHDNTVAIHGHDCGNPQRTTGGGSVLEQEQGFDSTKAPYNNVNYVKAERMLWYSTSQTGGNGVNLYGWLHNNLFKIVEANDMAGAAVHCLAKAAWPNTVVEIGRAHNVLQNPRELVNDKVAWMPQGGVVYKDVTTT